MKQLCALSNTDKARELNRFLPYEIKPMLEYVHHWAGEVVASRSGIMASPAGFASKESWIAMATDIFEDLNIGMNTPRRSHAKLLEMMTGGYGAPFLIHSMIQYSRSAECKSALMKAAINLFYIACDETDICRHVESAGEQ